MTTEERLVETAIGTWKLVVGRADKLFSGLSEEQLQEEIAPGRNRLVYLWGHLTGVHDRMLPLLRVGERLHPEFDALFLASPDRTVAALPSKPELKAAWDTVNGTLLSGLGRLSPGEWLERHADVSEEDFAKEPARNRLAVFLNRTNHTSFHLGQAVLTRRPVK